MRRLQTYLSGLRRYYCSRRMSAQCFLERPVSIPATVDEAKAEDMTKTCAVCGGIVGKGAGEILLRRAPKDETSGNGAVYGRLPSAQKATASSLIADSAAPNNSAACTAPRMRTQTARGVQFNPTDAVHEPRTPYQVQHIVNCLLIRGRGNVSLSAGSRSRSNAS